MHLELLRFLWGLRRLILSVLELQVIQVAQGILVILAIAALVEMVVLEVTQGTLAPVGVAGLGVAEALMLVVVDLTAVPVGQGPGSVGLTQVQV